MAAPKPPIRCKDCKRPFRMPRWLADEFRGRKPFRCEDCEKGDREDPNQ